MTDSSESVFCFKALEFEIIMEIMQINKNIINYEISEYTVDNSIQLWYSIENHNYKKGEAYEESFVFADLVDTYDDACYLNEWL